MKEKAKKMYNKTQSEEVRIREEIKRMLDRKKGAPSDDEESFDMGQLTEFGDHD